MNKPVAERNSFDNNVALGIQNIVSNAMNMISDVSSVKFVKRTDQSDYVKIVDKGVRVDIGPVLVSKKKTRYLPYLSIIQTRYLSFHFTIIKELLITKDLQNYPHPEGNIVYELMHVLGSTMNTVIQTVINI
ncbi:hypothetical protein RirG_261780 [Rhizophagus irregularis DAOM 197198w]|uniref:Uncharacterized protein n=1 Tax=Rhizophagus irregularis (strain DAOM 197198w) TaxID=1432141 RepID=A0A015J996_RHIIW|nr:hypothetical protein RirG_261780 [Rhizophagus irregularis DAOM 197198w]